MSLPNHQQVIEKVDRCHQRIHQLAKKRSLDHLGSSLSCIEALVGMMEIRQEGDALICSKGHAAMAVHSVNVEYGFLEESTWQTFGERGSTLSLHVAPDYESPLTSWPSGSLGYGLSRATGHAFAKKMKGSGAVYALLSDGECQSGIIWEAAMFASHHHLSNLTVIVDRNQFQALGPTEEILALEPFEEKWKSFGWKTTAIDGHNIADILKSLQTKTTQPQVIIAETQKGHGLTDQIGSNNPHYFKLPT